MNTAPLTPLPPHRYTGTCWWCGGPADSREHRHKASDLRREFALGEYTDGDVAVVREGEYITVRGPNSGQVKFGAHFCARCNSQRSQPFDLAYDRFIDWYLANEDEVERTGVVRLDEIYDRWETGTPRLLRYFVKHIGCRIADSGFMVPNQFREFLDGRREPQGLVCSFEIDGVCSGINAIIKNNPTEHGTWGTST